MIEQLEQIRNLSAATDNSITSDQKIEAREKSENFLWNGKCISFFFKFGKSVLYQPKIGKIRDRFSKKKERYFPFHRKFSLFFVLPFSDLK